MRVMGLANGFASIFCFAFFPEPPPPNRKLDPVATGDEPRFVPKPGTPMLGALARLQASLYPQTCTTLSRPTDHQWRSNNSEVPGLGDTHMRQVKIMKQRHRTHILIKMGNININATKRERERERERKKKKERERQEKQTKQRVKGFLLP